MVAVADTSGCDMTESTFADVDRVARPLDIRDGSNLTQ
jgi:hypothetical protein